MTHKVKSLVVGGLMAGSLFMAVVPAIARDWHGNDRDHRWDDHYSYRDSYRGQDNDWYDPSWGRLRGSRTRARGDRRLVALPGDPEPPARGDRSGPRQRAHDTHHDVRG